MLCWTAMLRTLLWLAATCAIAASTSAPTAGLQLGVSESLLQKMVPHLEAFVRQELADKLPLHIANQSGDTSGVGYTVRDISVTEVRFNESSSSFQRDAMLFSLTGINAHVKFHYDISLCKLPIGSHSTSLTFAGLNFSCAIGFNVSAGGHPQVHLFNSTLSTGKFEVGELSWLLSFWRNTIKGQIESNTRNAMPMIAEEISDAANKKLLALPLKSVPFLQGSVMDASLINISLLPHVLTVSTVGKLYVPNRLESSFSSPVQLPAITSMSQDLLIDVHARALGAFGEGLFATGLLDIALTRPLSTILDNKTLNDSGVFAVIGHADMYVNASATAAPSVQFRRGQNPSVEVAFLCALGVENNEWAIGLSANLTIQIDLSVVVMGNKLIARFSEPKFSHFEIYMDLGESSAKPVGKHIGANELRPLFVNTVTKILVPHANELLGAGTPVSGLQTAVGDFQLRSLRTEVEDDWLRLGVDVEVEDVPTVVLQASAGTWAQEGQERGGQWVSICGALTLTVCALALLLTACYQRDTWSIRTREKKVCRRNVDLIDGSEPLV